MPEASFRDNLFKLEHHFMRKVFAALALSLSVLLLLGFWAIQRINHEFVHQQIQGIVSSSQQFLSSEINEDIERMMDALDHVREYNDFSRLLGKLQLSPVQLDKIMGSSGLAFKAQFSMRFYDQSGKLLIAQDDAGDADSVLMDQVLQKRTEIKGVLINADGMPFIRTAAPVYHQNQLIGAVELVKSFNVVINDLKKIIHRDFYVVVDKALVNRQRLLSSLDRNSLLLAADLLSSKAVISSAVTRETEVLQQVGQLQLINDIAELERDHSSEDQLKMLSLAIPGLDKSQASLGIVIDFQPFLQQVRETESLTLIQGLMVVVFLLISVYLILNRIQMLIFGYRQKAEYEANKRNLEREQHIAEMELHLQNLESTIKTRTQDLQIAHEEMAISEARYRRLVDNIGDGFSIFSFLPDGEVLYASPGIKNLLEIELDDISGRSWPDLVNWLPESLAVAQQEIDSISREEKLSLRMEMSFVLPHGRIKTLSVALHGVYDVHGDFYCLEGITEDITEQRKMLQNLAHFSREANKANQAKSQFIAEMSHELRTPMHAIMSFSALALKRVDDDKARAFLEKIRISGARLTDLLNDILDLSKLEAGKMDLLPTEIDISGVITSTVEDLHGLLFDSQIKVKQRFAAGMFCDADERLMQQVITNLLSNAIKFSPQNSNVQIALEYVTVHDRRFLQIAVIDEGVGVPVDQLETIFDQFEQSTTTRGEYRGTGLGLPIVKKIVQLHGGNIWAESPVAGQASGTAVYVQIPQKQQTVTSLRAAGSMAV